MSREMQSLLLKLFPENPMAPALQKGAQGLLEATDFISQRQFERTALYNEIMRPNGVRYHLLIPLKLPGHIVATSVNGCGFSLPILCAPTSAFRQLQDSELWRRMRRPWNSCVKLD